VADWREAFTSSDCIVLLDEPLRGIPDGDEKPLTAKLKQHAAAGGSAVVVTHNLRFARDIADNVLFVCARELRAACSADAFFGDPPNDLTRKFVSAGNCSVSAPEPALPSHFRWVLAGQLAGMGTPGLLGSVDDDLTAVANAGVSMLVSLTEKPFDQRVLRSYGIRCGHLPIRDMDVPALGKAASMCAQIDRFIDAGNAAAVHCRAGLGRTGTILAAMLVWRGMDADQAITSVRRVCRHYIQRPAQIRFVHQFAERHG
jgi:atypical dual specificity phosphatase